MGRPRLDVEQFRSVIMEKLNAGWAYDAIIHFLYETYQFKVSLSTFNRHLRKWNVRRETRTIFSDSLLRRILELFFNQRLSDSDILRCLQEEGFTISKTGLEDLRKCHQLWRRQRPEQLEEAYTRAVEYFHSTDDDARALRSLGREFLYTYMRQRGHVISRDVLYEAYREVFPDEVANRYKEMRYGRKGWTRAQFYLVARRLRQIASVWF